jgi:hypothetical protein
MKKLIYPVIAIAISFSLLVACNKEGEPVPVSNVSQVAESGKWKISLFNDSGKDETYHFTGYEFTFNDGRITVSKNGTTVSGTYGALRDDGKNKLALNFGAITPFDELNDDWDIVEESKSRIRLEDVSGGNGGTDLLTFEKL